MFTFDQNRCSCSPEYATNDFDVFGMFGRPYNGDGLMSGGEYRDCMASHNENQWDNGAYNHRTGIWDGDRDGSAYTTITKLVAWPDRRLRQRRLTTRYPDRRSCYLDSPTWCIVVNERIGQYAMGSKENKGKMKSRSKASVRPSISFPPDHYKTLEEIAKEKKVSLAWVVRDVTERYVEEQQSLSEKG